MFNRLTELVIKYVPKGTTRSAKYNVNVLVMFLCRGLSVLVSLLYVPLLLKTLDRADYGILITLTSIIGWVAMLDIGLGNGLRNKLSVALSENDYQSARIYVSTTYAAVTIYIGVITVLFLIINNFLNWSIILNADPHKESELQYMAVVVFLSFGLSFIFGILNTILFSFQMPAYQSIIGFISQVVGFLVVYVLVKFYGVTSILVIAAVTSLVAPITLLICSVFLFKTTFKSISPTFELIKYSALNSIMSIGVRFFILQIITIVLFQVNIFIISHVISNEVVVEYNLAFRYLDTISIVFTIFVTPVWSASAEAYSKKDYHWIKKTVSKLVKIALLISLMGVVMLVFSNQIFNLWLGKGILNIDKKLIGMVLLYVTFKNLYQCYGFVINGTGKIKAQMLITLIMAIVYIPLAVFLGYIYGVYGIVLVSFLSQFFNFIWSRFQYRMLIKDTAIGIWNK